MACALSRLTHFSSATSIGPFITRNVDPSFARRMMLSLNFLFAETSKGRCSTSSNFPSKCRATSKASKIIASTAFVGGSFHRVPIAAAVMTSFSLTPSSKGTVGTIELSFAASLVNVPVLSTHKTFMRAKSSMTRARATMHDFFANARTPKEVVVCTIVRIAKGVLMIKRMTANDSERKKSFPPTMRYKNTLSEDAHPTTANERVTMDTFASNADISLRDESLARITRAARPANVCFPVRTTIALAEPRLTTPRVNNGSPFATSTVCLSPVIKELSKTNVCGPHDTQSAGTAHPGVSVTMSPGTRKRASTTRDVPDLVTVARASTSSANSRLARTASSLSTCDTHALPKTNPNKIIALNVGSSCTRALKLCANSNAAPVANTRAVGFLISARRNRAKRVRARPASAPRALASSPRASSSPSSPEVQSFAPYFSNRRAASRSRRPASTSASKSSSSTAVSCTP